MNYKNYNDYELLYMVRENDDNSNNILINKYLPILKRISADYYLKYSDYGYEYEDFLQESLVAFQNAIINYSEKKDMVFYSFAVLCVNRRMISFCRTITNDRKNISSSELISIDDIDFEDKMSNIKIIIEDKEFDKVIANCIVNMDLDCSSILELRYNGFSYREISVLLDLPRSTIEYRTRKLRKILRDLLNKR